jgi:sulfonate transport system permease protein
MTAIAQPAPRAPFPYAAILPWLSPLAVLLLWWGVTAAALFPREILVPPSAVLAAAGELWHNGDLTANLAATFHRLFTGFAAGAVAGIGFGIAAALVPAIEAYTAPLFNIVRMIPTIAFIPVLILIFGIDETFKILIVAKATFFPVALATIEGVRGIPKSYVDVARVYQLPPVYRLRRVILPAALPAIVTGVRLGLGRSWGVLVAAEIIASESGLGQMMEFGRQMFRLDVVMVGVVIAGIIGFTLDRSLRLLERRLQRWKER